MTEKWKTRICEQFYCEYDNFLQILELHKFLIDYLRKEFAKVVDVTVAHKRIVRIFIKYITSRIIEGNPCATQNLKELGPSYRKIFDFCYKKYFHVEQVPLNPVDIDRSLFTNNQDCFKIFKCVEELENKDEHVDIILSEFRFVGEFSRFIYAYRKKEQIQFFRRFLFIYPFDAKGVVSDNNREWREKHIEQFEKIKQDKKSEQDLAQARDWYANQLDKIDFDGLTEEEKASFFTESFVAFGNISSKKNGKMEGYIPELKNLLYLGRYYNVHLLPLNFIKWEPDSEEGEMVAYLAHETYRRCCGNKMIYDEKRINEAEEKGVKKIALDSQLGKKDRRLDVKRLKTQQSSGEMINQGDSVVEMMNKFMRNVPFSNMAQKHTSEEALEEITNLMKERGVINYLKAINPNGGENIRMLLQNENIRSLQAEWYEKFASAGKLFRSKSSAGITTHYDTACGEMKGQISEKLMRTFLSLFAEE